jgi:phosphate acetyltransferase
MGFIDRIKVRAKADKKTIVLPETTDIRTIEAASKVLKEDIVNVILVGNKEEIDKLAVGYDLTGARFVDPYTYEKFDEYVDKLVDLRRKKGMTREKAEALLKTNGLYFGCMMVKEGDADGMVAGAINSSADVLRAALQILKTAPGTRIVSAFFLVVVPNCDMGANGTFIFSDAGLNQSPNAAELADIAEQSAKSFELLVEEEPVVAMLSHSTKGSATHPDVDKVIEATQIVKAEYPDLKVDGELQSDAAIVPSVAAAKAPDSEVAGHANVLVFPDLDAGNIGYKLVQRLAKADAYGPVTQGIAKPVNDLSRGCCADDIVGVIAITAIQAQAAAQERLKARPKEKYNN